jgi:hypothetical protein
MARLDKKTQPMRTQLPDYEIRLPVPRGNILQPVESSNAPVAHGLRMAIGMLV